MELLICDDETEAAAELAEFFSCNGIAAKLVSHISDAREEILRATKPLCLVTDMRMPGGDGGELIRWLRHEAPPERRLSPAILLSGHAAKDSETEIQMDHFDLRLRKPVNPEEILEILKDLGLSHGS